MNSVQINSPTPVTPTIVDRIKISRARRGTDFIQPDHYHSFYEIFYLLSGKCRFLLRDSLYSLESGDFIFITPGELHHALYYSNVTCDVIFIYFREDYLLPEMFAHMPGGKMLPLHSFMGSIPGLYYEEFQTLMARMLSENMLIDEHSLALLTCHLHELFLLLMRHSVMSEAEPELINAKEADILVATKFIYKNFQSPLTLDQVAGVANLSPTYFSKKFKAITGMGFKEYLNYIRLKHAAAALLTTRNTITDIALEYGFNDSNYFKDLFKKEYGKSPREFRKSREGNS